MEILFFAIMVLVLVGAVATITFPFHVGWYIYRQLTYKKRNRPRPSGLLTLIHFWIALTGLIAVVITPVRFPHHGKAPQSEAKTNLGAIFTTQVSYFGETGTYAGGPEAFSLLHWEPEGMSKYAYFCGDDFLPNTKREPIPASERPVQVGTSATGFTCAAVGNIDNDPDLDYWLINDAKVISQEPGTDL